MIAGHALLAVALCFILIAQILTFIPASAVIANNFEGDWTGKIDKIHDWSNEVGDTERYRISGDIVFTADKYGHIDGQGTVSVEYTVHVHDSAVGDCDYQGQRDNLAFNILGDYDKDTGEASFQINDPPYFFDMQGTYTPGRLHSDNYCPGEHGYLISPFANSYRYGPFDLLDGATVNGALQYEDAGTNRVAIQGPADAPKNECPALTITPTMPPASDPRNLAGPNDSASYRFQVAWERKTPTKVYFDTGGGNDSVNPSFTFNPANMQTSPISVLMDVTTNNAELGGYPITVDAWIIDPDTGEECHATESAQVTLVVSEESRAADLGLVERSGDVQVDQETVTTGDQATVIQTGDDGAATLKIADNSAEAAGQAATVELGSNTKVKQFDRVNSLDDELMADLLDEEVKIQKDRAARQTLAKQFTDVFNDVRQLFNENIEKPAEENLSCVLAWLDEDIAGLCTGQKVLFIENGDLYYKNVSKFVRGGLMVDSDSIVIPTGTELAMSVQKDGSSRKTSITLLEGSAIVIDFASEKVQFVKAGERYTTESAAGQVVTASRLENVSADTVQHWWKLKVGDYATSKDWDDKTGPVNRATLFTDQDTVHTWIKFINVLPPERLITFKFYKPDGSLFWNNTNTLDAVGPQYRSWSSYTMGGGYFELNKFPADNNYGRWKIDVYDGDQLVQQMSFYVVKYGFVNNQSAKYTFDINVKDDDPQVASSVEGSLASVIGSAFAGNQDADIQSASDIEWIKTTVVGSSPMNARMQAELKSKGIPSIKSEPVSFFGNDTAIFLIPTVGIDGNFTIPTNSAGAFPSRIALGNTVDLDVGGSGIKAYEFTGSKKVVDKSGSSDISVTAHYEKYSGMLIDYIVRGSMVDPQAGSINLEFGLKATEVSIPTTLAITSIPGEIQQNNDAVITGKTSPAVSVGQVVLTYHKDGSEPIKRAVPVTDGAFSDRYRMEEDGTYAVYAEYLGSGAYLSSTADAKTLTVAPSGCLIATAAYGSEFAPQVQMLRQIRDGQLLKTSSGSSFMSAFNYVYYSFSPTVANWERENPAFREAVKIAITPLIATLGILPHVSMDSEAEALGYGAGIILLNIAIYFVAPAFAIMAFRSRFGKKLPP